MKTKVFDLTTKQLKDIAIALQKEVETGLNKEGAEIQCIPTYIIPKTNIQGKALVLDLGGTNYRNATIEFKDGKTDIHPQDGYKKDLTKWMKHSEETRQKKEKGEKTEELTELNLFQQIADLIPGESNETLPIGYCFSYPAESEIDGDATLIRWTKGVDIPEMIGKKIGQPLLNYLNSVKDPQKYSSIKVINDTVASLFAGCSLTGYDAYIGLIVGTGTNMATFINSENIPKIKGKTTLQGLLPINLESGNFHPPHLTEVDNLVDENSDNKGAQRFEKAISGMYLGDVLKYSFPEDQFEEGFDGQAMNYMMNNPDIHVEKFVSTAHAIYIRSARLVAASIIGLILHMKQHDNNIKKICLTAEGGLFWSHNKKGEDYNLIVQKELDHLLAEFGMNEVKVEIANLKNANLIGSAVAALS